MGNPVSSFVQSVIDALSRLFSIKRYRVLLLGLDDAGKTTLLHRLKLGKAVLTTPTTDFHDETIRYRNVEFTVRDVGWQRRIRSLLHHSVRGTNAVIYVVDASDRERTNEAADGLRVVFEHDDLRDAKLLVFATKQDRRDAMSIEEVHTALSLDNVEKSTHHIEAAVAITGKGLYEGLDWLCQALSDQSEDDVELKCSRK